MFKVNQPDEVEIFQDQTTSYADFQMQQNNIYQDTKGEDQSTRSSVQLPLRGDSDAGVNFSSHSIYEHHVP